jgi:hypothetical protein
LVLHNLALSAGAHAGQPSVDQPVHNQQALGQNEAAVGMDADEGDDVPLDVSKMMEQALVTLKLVQGMQRQHGRLLRLLEHAASKV